MILFSFLFGGCVDEVVDNRTNYQGYKYVYFLQYHTVDKVNITKVKSQDEKPKDQNFTLAPHSINRCGYFMGYLMRLW